MRTTRRGFAIPMAAGFCVLITILIGATAWVRSQSKRQTRANFQAMKAHFLAQGTIQVALYKFRVLPNEGYDASAEASGDALRVFLTDVDTKSLPLQVTPPGTTWTSSILDGKAINSVSEGYDDWLHVVRLTAEGRVQDGYLAPDGSAEERVEELIKTVEVRKERN